MQAEKSDADKINILNNMKKLKPKDELKEDIHDQCDETTKHNKTQESIRMCEQGSVSEVQTKIIFLRALQCYN